MAARVRISDIAQEAGVSPATVSRYLNNRPGSMSEETRTRIAEVIERTGYRPNSVARSLRTDRTHVLGVILSDIRNPFFSAMLEGLSTRAARDGYSLMTAVTANSSHAEAEAINRLTAAGVDGLIVNTCGGNDDLIAKTSRQTPVVLLDRDAANGTIDLVTSNNGALMAQLVDALAADGCTRCYLMTEHNDTSSIRRERSNQFTREMAAHALKGDILALESDAAQAAEQLGALLGECEEAGPLGLIAINGLVFLRLIDALNTAGIAVPAQVRLATFDDYAWNRVLYGGVTTAAQDTQAMADAIVELILERIESEDLDDDGLGGKPTARTRIEVPGSVIKRASTAPAPLS